MPERLGVLVLSQPIGEDPGGILINNSILPIERVDPRPDLLMVRYLGARITMLNSKRKILWITG